VGDAAAFVGCKDVDEFEIRGLDLSVREQKIAPPQRMRQGDLF
jgi:hypothetical protein